MLIKTEWPTLTPLRDNIIICTDNSQRDQVLLYKELNIMDTPMLVYLHVGCMDMRYLVRKWELCNSGCLVGTPDILIRLKCLEQEQDYSIDYWIKDLDKNWIMK